MRVALDLARHADGGRTKARDIATAPSTPRASHSVVSILRMWARSGPSADSSTANMRDGACSGDGTTCSAHDVWFRAHSALRQHLAGSSLADVAAIETRSRQ